MESLNSILFVYVVLGIFVSCCRGWVFTDIDYDDVLRSMALDYDENDLENAVDDMMNAKFSLIYPGTKWCGPGNVADDFNDLGSSAEADMCCRAHDHCPDVILAGETKHNLTNTAFYSRISCDCDEKFRRCLRKANNSDSARIGNIYFNALGTKCFRKDYPKRGCKKNGGWLGNKCIKYEYDYNGEKIYQWFDVPNF
ncbi:hypothetical protein evm_001410 [Chilo suppressalis]|nr:hypothetical protein evm_001410 [Chilo suppressalis]